MTHDFGGEATVCKACGIEKVMESLCYHKTNKRYTCEEFQADPPLWHSAPNVYYPFAGQARIIDPLPDDSGT